MGAGGQRQIEKVFDRFTGLSQVHEAVLSVEDSGGEFSFSKGYGGKGLDSPLLMASITKLFTTCCILLLREQGDLSLGDRVAKFIDTALLTGLHVYKGEEYSFELTISDLLSQTSGLPDIYEEGRNSAKNRVMKEDFHLTFEEILAWAKKLQPHFAPHSMPRAYYADINFDILGEIIEKVSGLTLADAYRRHICEPLGLAGTHLPVSEDDRVPGIYHGDRLLHRPKVVLSSRASGGCITTARDLMAFIKAFFGGGLFDRAIFDRLSTYNRLQASMSPINYGGGYMRIPLGGWPTMFMGKGELLGHSGSTGSFAFYYPRRELFFVGDLNQMANAALPVRLSMQLAMAVK